MTNGEREDVDWTCDSCGARSAPDRQTCAACGVPRSPAAAPRSRAAVATGFVLAVVLGLLAAGPAVLRGDDRDDGAAAVRSASSAAAESSSDRAADARDRRIDELEREVDDASRASTDVGGEADYDDVEAGDAPLDEDDGEPAEPYDTPSVGDPQEEDLEFCTNDDEDDYGDWPARDAVQVYASSSDQCGLAEERMETWAMPPVGLSDPWRCTGSQSSYRAACTNDTTGVTVGIYDGTTPDDEFDGT